MNEYSHWGYEIYTWRTQAKQEVDLVLYGGKEKKIINDITLWPLELFLKEIDVFGK